VIFAFSGTAPPPSLVTRIRRGEAAGVILFGANVRDAAGVRRLTRRLQAIPRPPGLRAPLLVMVDQEGGEVRRLPSPPEASAAAMGGASTAAVRDAGRATGRALRAVGVNVDLAPVADLSLPGGFIAAQARGFAARPAGVERAARAFAAGLASTGVAAAAKHFPGLGAAEETTDRGPVRIPLSREALRVHERPFASLVRAGVPLVMLSTASYPAIDDRPAALSAAVVRGELRDRLGFRGVTITDALDTPGLTGRGGTAAVAVRAAAAGADLLLYAGGAASERAADSLAAAIAAGRLRREPAEAAVARVLALRRGLGSGR
jgi:beta-N-acetylhexosaminidase